MSVSTFSKFYETIVIAISCMSMSVAKLVCWPLLHPSISLMLLVGPFSVYSFVQLPELYHIQNTRNTGLHTLAKTALSSYKN